MVDVTCPHCDTQFHVQPDVVGKAMRCPSCREVFTAITSLDAPLPPPPDNTFNLALPEEVPYERIENAPPVVLEAERVNVPRAAILLPNLPTAVPVAEAVKAKPAKTAKPLPVAKMLAPPVTEADWREAPPPAVKEKTEEPNAVLAEIVPPTRKRDVWPTVLAGLIVTLAVVIGVATWKIFSDRAKAEGNLAADALHSFKEHNYPEAARQYGELLEKYPQSADAERYKFFEALASLQNAASSNTLKDDPAPARGKWDSFIKDFSASPLAKTDADGYGLQIFDAGRKLVEGYVAHADFMLSKYRGERAKLERLTKAEAATVDGRAFIPQADRYRTSEEKPLAEYEAKFDAAAATCLKERERLAVLAPYRDLADDPVEDRIAEFNATLARHSLKDDDEALALIAAANTKLRSLLKLITQEKEASQPAVGKDNGTLVTVAIPAGRSTVPLATSDLPAETFFALARGWLYALDVDTGDLLWSTRVGTVQPPLVIAGSDLILVPSLVDGVSKLTARQTRTGTAVWVQTLEAPIAGGCAFVGGRVYVPLTDAAGTFIEFDARSGHRAGHFQLRQRIGPGIVRLPNTNLIAVVADARRIFLLDTAPLDAQGDRQPLRLRHVLKTEHPSRSLRVPPVFTGDGTLTMVLAQQEGTASTKIRAISVPDVSPGEDVAESVATDLAVATLAGQVTFPAASDGERVAFASDVGALGLYRTNAPGNLDAGLFTIPFTPLTQQPHDPLPAVAGLSHEDGVWLFARGLRTHLSPSVSPAGGLKFVLKGTAQAAGLPQQPLELFPQRNAAGVVLHAEANDSVRAVLFDFASGRTRWERVLGTIAATPPIAVDSHAVVIDDDGGITKVTEKSTERIAAPLISGSSPAKVVDNTWILVPLGTNRVHVRQLVNGKLTFDAEAPLPAAFSGNAASLGTTFVVPLADGFLHRFDPARRLFVAGPMWKVTTGDCVLSVRGDQILTSDASRKLQRWGWPTDGEWTANGTLELRDKPVFPPLWLSPNELLIADASGTVGYFDMSKTNDPLRKWRPAPAVPSSGFIRVGKHVAYTVDRRMIVWLDPNGDAEIITRPPDAFDILALGVIDNRLVAVDLAGTLTAYEGTTPVATQTVTTLPRTFPLKVNQQLLQPQADGTLRWLPLLRKADS